jgi:hypothetical protein
MNVESVRRPVRFGGRGGAQGAARSQGSLSIDMSS